jgi:hypothetical protein
MYFVCILIFVVGKHPCPSCEWVWDKNYSNSQLIHQNTQRRGIYNNFVSQAKNQIYPPIVPFHIFNFVPSPLHVFLGIGTHIYEYLLVEASNNKKHNNFIDTVHSYNIYNRSQFGNGLIGIEVERLLINRINICKSAYNDSNLQHNMSSSLSFVHRHKSYKISFNDASSRYNMTLKWMTITYHLYMLCMQCHDFNNDDILRLRILISEYAIFRTKYPIYYKKPRPIFPKEHFLVHHFFEFAVRFKCLCKYSEQATEANHQITKKHSARNKNTKHENKAQQVLINANLNKLAKSSLLLNKI